MLKEEVIVPIAVATVSESLLCTAPPHHVRLVSCVQVLLTDKGAWLPRI